MRTVTIACLVTTALVSGHLRLMAAENIRLRHLASVYLDDKETGLKLPEGVACGARGLLVVADTGNGRLLRFSFQDQKLSGGREVKVPQLSAPSRIHLKLEGRHLRPRRQAAAHRPPRPRGRVQRPSRDGRGPAARHRHSKELRDRTQRTTFMCSTPSSARVLVVNAQGQFQRALPLPADAGFVSELTVDAAGTVFLVDSIKRRMFSAAKDAAAFTQLGGDLSASVATLPTSLTASKGMIFIAEGSRSSIVAFDGTARFSPGS